MDAMHHGISCFHCEHGNVLWGNFEPNAGIKHPHESQDLPKAQKPPQLGVTRSLTCYHVIYYLIGIVGNQIT